MPSHRLQIFVRGSDAEALKLMKFATGALIRASDFRL